MDWASLASVVGAFGTFLSGAAALLQLLKSPRRSTVLLTSIFTLSVAVTAVGGIIVGRELKQLQRETRVASIVKGFGAPGLEDFGTNGLSNFEPDKDTDEIPDAVDQYAPSTVQNGESQTPTLVLENPPLVISTQNSGHVLLFSPVLHDEVTCGWAGFRVRPKSTVDLHRAKYLILLVNAAEDDVLEIKLQDKKNQGDRVPLLVKKGWAYYIFPMNRFGAKADLDLVKELAVTYSCVFKREHAVGIDPAVASVDPKRLKNEFVFGLIEARS